MFSLVHHGHSRPTIITLPVLEGCCVFRVCVSVCQLVLGCGDLHLALSQSLWQCLCLPVVLDHTVTTSIIRRPAFSPSAPCSLFVFALCPCWLCAPSCPSCPLSCAFRGVFVQVHPCAAPFFVVPVGSVAPSRRVAAFHGIAHAACSCEAFSLAFLQLSGWRGSLARFLPALRLARRPCPPHGGGLRQTPHHLPHARSVGLVRPGGRPTLSLSLRPSAPPQMRPCACPPSRHGTSFRVIANMPPACEVSSLASSASPADAAPCSLPQSHVGAATQNAVVHIDGDR